jgi:DNA-binding CsgD family transcriptional regulator
MDVSRIDDDKEGLGELVELLVDRVARINGDSHPCVSEEFVEEVILDIDVGGVRYLLVRLPESSKNRIQLSPREQEIVRMVAIGHPNKIIADVLNLRVPNSRPSARLDFRSLHG